ncbi:type II toxin-antitoxin system RelE/ParE family toxin [Dyella humi]|uniref:type II toxin-antitoxin system RelE/ParE family toxin n=1 Tax=Dyella humi TaxID=1770547 RepID=UPI003620830D
MKYIIRQTEAFAVWLKELRDVQARAAITRRLERAANGNLGDVQTIRESVSEMRVDMGKGYRLYFTTRGRVMIVLLCGGDKKSQRADIKRALHLVQEYRL